MTYQELLERSISHNLIRIVLSKPVKGKELSKVRIRPVTIKGEDLFQVTKTIGSKENNTFKEIHENLNSKEVKRFLTEAIPGDFLQGLFETEDAGFTVLSNKKGTITCVSNKTVTGEKKSTDHNRKKNYLIDESDNAEFLIDLGVKTRDGKIVKAKYDKFRQINRYLEFIESSLYGLKEEKNPVIIDFGCGKSYLTFALYYYLTVKKGMTPKIIGLDLKTDVIKECNRLRDKYKYTGLEFIEGDIEHFTGIDHVNMVISLHACDTATDFALFKAIKWDADIIMAVPCCQHELNRKIKTPELKGATQYGILKDRLSAIVTDAYRANTLKEYGYETDILEFIDMDHTPKNLLIRGVKKSGMVKPGLVKENESFKDFVGEDITLQRLLKS